MGSLFFRLDECTKNIVKSVGRYHMVTHANTFFCKSSYESGLKLSPKATQYESRNGGGRGERSSR